ncbi:glycosyltransferase [Pseudomonadota bacterium]
MAEPISVLIITRERREMLDLLLSDLALQDYPGTVEIIVVEETDSPREIEGAVYLPHPKLDKGIAFARNMTVRHASHDLLVFIDDDCRVGSDWLSRLVAPFEDQAVLGVQGGVTVPDTTNAIGWAETLLGFPGGGVTRIHESSGMLEDTLEVSTLNAGYRKDAVMSAKGFSDHAHFGGEDFLLAREVAKLGRLCYVPDAVVKHEARGNLKAIWHWFVRRGRAELEMWQAGLAPKGYGAWMLRASLSLKLFPFIALSFWSLLPLFGMLFVLMLLDWWRFHWVLSQTKIPSLGWFVLPWVKISMGVATDVGRFKAWWVS